MRNLLSAYYTKLNYSWSILQRSWCSSCPEGSSLKALLNLLCVEYTISSRTPEGSKILAVIKHHTYMTVSAMQGVHCSFHSLCPHGQSQTQEQEWFSVLKTTVIKMQKKHDYWVRGTFVFRIWCSWPAVSCPDYPVVWGSSKVRAVSNLHLYIMHQIRYIKHHITAQLQAWKKSTYTVTGRSCNQSGESKCKSKRV